MQAVTEGLLLGAIPALFTLLAWPLLEKSKIRVVARSLRKQAARLDQRLPAIETGLAEMPDDERENLDTTLSGFQALLAAFRIEGPEPSRYAPISAQIDSLTLKFSAARTLATRIQLALVILPFVLNHASDIDLSSITPGFAELRAAGDTLKAQMLSSGSPVLRRVARESLWH